MGQKTVARLRGAKQPCLCCPWQQELKMKKHILKNTLRSGESEACCHVEHELNMSSTVQTQVCSHCAVKQPVDLTVWSGPSGDAKEPFFILQMFKPHIEKQLTGRKTMQAGQHTVTGALNSVVLAKQQFSLLMFLYLCRSTYPLGHQTYCFNSAG